MGKLILRAGAALSLALFALGAPLPLAAQGQPQALVIEGGTLIDGNGGAPVANSVIVVQGNRITNVSRVGQGAYPAGARIIDARGKWVLPSLWDSQGNYSWFYGELELNQGVTSAVDVGLGEEVSILHREAVNRGKIRGPRRVIGIGYFGNVDPKDLTGLETDLAPHHIPKTVEEVRTMSTRLLDAGADMVMFHDGRLFTPDLVRAGCEVAHARNKPCTQRPLGVLFVPQVRPVMGVKEAALAGVDIIPHAQGVEHAVARDGVDAGNNVLDNFAEMDDAKARDLIALLVKEDVYLVPANIHIAPGYPKDWDRMYAAVRKTLTDPNLLAYYPQEFIDTMRRTRDGVDTGAVRERRMRGYQNLLRFYKMLDAAGGKALIGGDTNASKVSGFAVHEEMEIFQEAGIPRMHIIQGATKWAADAWRMNDRLGSIEAGKLADILIVNADPLADVANLRNIDTLIFDGRVVNRAFTPYYSTPFLGTGDDLHVVEGLGWTLRLKEATFASANAKAPPNPPISPQPAIQTIAPIWATEGDPTITLKLTGFNFVARTRVLFDGVSVPWRWVSPTELAVTLDETLLRRVGRFDVVVQNPTPVDEPDWGNGTSNKAHFLVNFKYDR